MKITKQRLKQIIREELQAEAKEDAMRNSIRKGRYIDDIPDREDEETVDRAFDSPEGRLITHIEARKVLDNMTIEELEDFAMSLDASMAATLRHILSNRMYDPMEESDEMELEEGATPREKEINFLVTHKGFSLPQATAIVDGGPEKRAEFERLSKKYSRSAAHKHVYGGSNYSAYGQR